MRSTLHDYAEQPWCNISHEKFEYGSLEIEKNIFLIIYKKNKDKKKISDDSFRTKKNNKV